MDRRTALSKTPRRGRLLLVTTACCGALLPVPCCLTASELASSPALALPLGGRVVRLPSASKLSRPLRPNDFGRSGCQATRQESQEDALALLDLPQGSERQDIRRRYRELAATEHPDVKPDDPEAEERFERITEAYQELMELESLYTRRASRDEEAAPREPQKKFKNSFERRTARAAELNQELASTFAGPVVALLAAVGLYFWASTVYCSQESVFWCGE